MVAFNFGLVHQPAEFDYSSSIDSLPDELTADLETIDPNWRDVLQAFTDQELLLLRWSICWKQIARAKQLPPESFVSAEKIYWGIRSGRGFGKTLSAANWLGLEAAKYRSFYAVVSPTHDDVRYTCFEGPTGLYACIPPQLIVGKNAALPSCTLWNGSIIRGFAGDTPERLRGPQHAKAWCDEIASWKYPQDAWDNLMFGLRLGPQPQVVWTGTPKPTAFMRQLNADPSCVVTVGSTYENRENLTESFYKNIAKYEGTKVGRQEVYGEILDPEEEGFVKRSDWRLWPHDRPLPKLRYIVLSLDTAFTEKTFDKKVQKGDPTACSVWGVFGLKRSRSELEPEEVNVILLDCWEDWLGLPALIKRVKKEKELTYGDADEPLLRPKIIPIGQRARHTGRKPDIILIEDKGSGISLRQSLATENILTEGYNPNAEDKLTRLHVVSPMFSNRRVWAVESELRRGTFKVWADPLITQVCSYVGPGSTERDDLLDTATQALRLIMAKFFGSFTVKENPEDVKRAEAAREVDRRKRKNNPYAT